MAIISKLYVLIVFALLLNACSEKSILSNGNEDNDDLQDVVDIDGNVYKTVKIGNQIWMAENLRVTCYQNGDTIPHIESNTSWNELTFGAYSSYNNEPINEFGLLYNWYAVNSSLNISPQGWHVASDDEWKKLEMYFGMSISEVEYIGFRGTDEGSQFKDGDFNALYGGFRGIDGNFRNAGSNGYWWTATEFCRLNAWYYGLTSESDMVNRNFDSKVYGFSVRCVKD